MADFEEWEKTTFRCIAGVALLLFLYNVHMLTARIDFPLSVLVTCGECRARTNAMM